MKLFNTLIEVLSSNIKYKKRLKLKKNMGFPISLSDVENIVYVKKRNWRKNI